MSVHFSRPIGTQNQVLKKIFPYIYISMGTNRNREKNISSFQVLFHEELNMAMSHHFNQSAALVAPVVPLGDSGASALHLA